MRWGKRGFAIQFNWLFVLLGGVVILGFFFSIINNQTVKQEGETAQKSTQEINDLLKVSLSSRDTQKIVSFEKKIAFSCDDEISAFYIGSAYKYSRYDYNAIFSPTELEGTELIVQTLVFEAPFKVLPLVHVTNRDTEYVFVEDAPVITIAYNSLPENVTKSLIPAPLGTIAAYPNNNYDHTVFVLTDESKLAGLTNFDNPNNKAYAVVIKSGSGTVIDYGNITFYFHDSSGFVDNGTAPFLGLDTISGAIISHDREIYECNLKKIMQRVELLAGLHSQRMFNYTNLASAICRDNYPLAQIHLDNIRTYASRRPLTVGDFQVLVGAMGDLKSLNSYLLTKTECPLIY